MESPEGLAARDPATDDNASPMTAIECSRCRRALGVPAELAGLVVECAHCRFRFVAPDLDPAAKGPAASGSAPLAVSEEPSAPQRTSAWQTLATVFGGFCGLVVGYYLLNFLWGAQFDLLRVPLPGVEHTRRWSERSVDGAPPALPVTQAPSARPIVQVGAEESSGLAAPVPPVDPPPAPAAAPADASVSPPVDSKEKEKESPPQRAAAQAPEPPGPLPSMAGAKPLSTGKSLAGGPPVRGASLVSAESLRRALSEAERVSACRRCNSTGRVERAAAVGKKRDGRPVAATTTPCDACGGAASARLSTEVYQALCEAAEASCFVEVREDDSLTEERQRLQTMLQRMASTREQANDLGRLGSLWLDNSKRDSTGIALAGTVQHVAREGRLWRVDILVFGRPRIVTVLAPHDGGLKEKDRVAVLGAIVDHPRYNLAGYTGDAQQVVWGGIPMKLGK